VSLTRTSKPPPTIPARSVEPTSNEFLKVPLDRSRRDEISKFVRAPPAMTRTKGSTRVRLECSPACATKFVLTVLSRTGAVELLPSGAREHTPEVPSKPAERESQDPQNQTRLLRPVNKSQASRSWSPPQTRLERHAAYQEPLRPNAQILKEDGTFARTVVDEIPAACRNLSTFETLNGSNTPANRLTSSVKFRCSLQLENLRKRSNE
jgi:hypothetical protein